MRSEWKEYKLSEITNKITKGTTPTAKDGGFLEKGINFIKAESVTLDGRIDSSKFAYISIKVHSKFKRSQLELNDILFSMAGVHLAKSAIVKDIHLPANTNQALALIRAVPKIVNPKYLYYYLQQNKIVKYVNNSTSQSAQPNINLQEIGNLSIILPNLETQKKAAYILSTLDDKIELNRKMNQTLETMAQALFKSWFVDFDPVIAKMRCKSEEELEAVAKELGISKEILELFPSEFETSELGMIPKGWEVKPLDEIAHYQNGLALQKFRPKNENEYLPVVKISQLNKGYADGEEKADINIKPECIIDSGDVVFSWSGTLLVDIWCGGKGALNQHLFKVTSTKYPKWFYYYWTKQHLFNFQHIAASKAVTMGHIKKSHLTEALCLIPCKSIFNIVEGIISPIVDKIIENRLENNTLQKTRDTLLPKLLSGEIDVSELEI